MDTSRLKSDLDKKFDFLISKEGKMAGRKKSGGSFPVKSSSVQSIAQVEHLKNALRDFQDQANTIFKGLDSRVKKLEVDLGNAYDLIDALSCMVKTNSPSQKGLFDFCSQKIEIPFLEMEDSAKINALMQYIEATQTFNDNRFNQFVYAAFDKRNGLERLPDGLSPEFGNFALIVWQFVVDDVPVVGSARPVIYNLGSKELMVDEDILKMSRGDKRQFTVKFDPGHPNPSVAGKEGILSIGIFDFKRKKASGQTKALTQEDKIKVWRENYKAQEIG